MSKKPSTASAMSYLHRKAKEAPKSDLGGQQRKLFRKALVSSKAPEITKDHDLERGLAVASGPRIDGGAAQEPEGFNERVVSFLDLYVPSEFFIVSSTSTIILIPKSLLAIVSLTQYLALGKYAIRFMSTHLCEILCSLYLLHVSPHKWLARS